MSDTNNAFVILPFEDEFERLYEEQIAPTLADQGYCVNKADELPTQGSIIEDIIKGITQADLIVADLTDTNPNVFYELGIAHGMGVPTVLIAQDISELPFDLSAYSTIEYSLRFDKISEFTEELSEITSGHLDKQIQFGSPVSDYGNVEIAQGSEANEQAADIEAEESSKKVEDDSGETEPDKGLLEYTAEIDEEMSDLEHIFDELEKDAEKFEAEIENQTKKVESLSLNNSSQSRKQINRIARKMAESISVFSDSVEEKIEPIDEKISFFMDTIESIIEFADPNRDDHRENLKDIYSDLEEFDNSLEYEIREIQRFDSEVSNIKGLNRKLDSSVNDLGENLASLESTLSEATAKSDRFKSLIQNDIDEFQDESS